MKKSVLLEFVKMFEAGDYAEMEKKAQKYVKQHPKDGFGYKALHAAMKFINKDGLEAARMAVKLLPHDYEAHYNMGTELQARDNHKAAIPYLQRALQLNPNSAKVYNNLGNGLRSQGNAAESTQCYYKAIQLDPTMAEAHLNLGNNLLGMGKYAKACDYFEKTLEIEPDFVEAHSNLIFALDLMSTENTESQQNARRHWAEAYTDQIEETPKFHQSLDLKRKLRIGYVSGDFREHSAARVFGAMLTEFDKSRFEVFCYDNKMQKDDSYTARFKQECAWRVIHKLPDDDVVAMIRNDHIDVLVDLSGHSAQNRLAVFARRAAPIQITAWGYATGTGVRNMDYFFCDPIMVPNEERHYFTEKIIDLPCVASSWFQEEFPPINELPALTNGFITFGSCNRLHKVTDECFQIWAEILNSVPNSRLILKAGELSDEAARAAAMWNFVRTGISADRITLIGNTSGMWLDHVATYNMIDITLEPFPHGGGVTLMEGLRMGCPSVALRWPSTVGRLSASILHTIGMADWVANSANDYVKMAVEKSTKLKELSDIRRTLRERFERSYLGDQRAYAGKVEEKYTELWKEYCNK